MLQVVTIAINGVTILILGGIIWGSRQSIKSTRETAKFIEAYRHDIAWLMARVDELEAKARAPNGK